MSASADPYAAIDQAVYVGTLLVVVGGLIALIVWSSRSSRRKRAQAATTRTPEGDMASLATVLVLQTAHDAAAALVSRVLAGHPQLTPVPGPVPTWSFAGRYPSVVLVESQGGAILRVHEVELPLLSPEPTMAWEWAAGSVEQDARRLGIPTVRGWQRLAPSRATGPTTTIWAATD